MAASLSSDHELIELVRSGDRSALGELYERHHDAGLRVARATTGESHDAEDLVSDAFERIHRAILRGGGPDESFRAYLYTTIRRLAIELGTADAHVEDTDDFAPYEALTAVDDGTQRSAEATIVASAFAALAPRHQAVLWYMDVEGMAASEAATYFGLSSNATSALANRARSALKDAYLQAHVSGTGVSAACAPVRGKLGPFRAGSLSARDETKVQRHLDECEECPVVLAELADVSHGLRVVIAPLVIGGAAAAAAVLGAPAQSATAAAVGAPGSRGLGRRTTIAAAAVAVLLIGAGSVAAATILGGGSSEAEVVADAPLSTDADAPSPFPPTRAATPTPSATPAKPTPPVRTAPPRTAPPSETKAPAPPVPTVPPTTPPAGTATLSLAFLDAGDFVRGRVGVLALDVANTGDGAAAPVELVIDIPSGVELDAARPMTTSGGIDWTCLPEAAAIRCTAPSAPAGATSAVYAPVVVAGDAPLLGAPAATVTSNGATSATATAEAVVVAAGLGTRFLADGSLAVVQAGASLLSCDAAEVGCLDARQRTGAQLNNNDWNMVAIDAAGIGVTSSSAVVDIPAGSVVRSAGLYWSSGIPSGADDTRLGAGVLVAPGGAAVDVAAQTVERQGSRYLSFLDVTAQVAAAGSGTWSFGDAAVTTGAGADAGWSLVIVLEHPSLPATRVAVFDGLQVIAPGSPAMFALPSVAGGSASVGAVAWDGDAAIAGDRVFVDDIALMRIASNATDNAFASWADGAVPLAPGDTNTFGFDTGLFAPIITSDARADVRVASDSETLFLGVVTLVTG